MKEHRDKYYYNDDSVSYGFNLNKTLHRIDGPAIEYPNGETLWYMDGKLHRTDGPAMEYPNGDQRWYIDGARYSKEAFDNLIRTTKTLSSVDKSKDPREWVRKIT